MPRKGTVLLVFRVWFFVFGSKKGTNHSPNPKHNTPNTIAVFGPAG
jgi:hypothetical protein